MLDHFVAKQIMAYFEVAMGNEKNLYEIVNRPVRYVEKRYVKPSTTLAQLKVYMQMRIVIRAMYRKFAETGRRSAYFKRVRYS